MLVEILVEKSAKVSFHKSGFFPLKYAAAIFRKTLEIKEKLASFLKHLRE